MIAAWEYKTRIAGQLSGELHRLTHDNFVVCSSHGDPIDGKEIAIMTKEQVDAHPNKCQDCFPGLLSLSEYDKGLLIVALHERRNNLKLNKPTSAINPTLWETYFNEIARLTELQEMFEELVAKSDTSA